MCVVKQKKKNNLQQSGFNFWWWWGVNQLVGEAKSSGILIHSSSFYTFGFCLPA